MSAKITILVDDRVSQGEGLLAEHGLSVLVEAGDDRVLFDTGQTGICLRNAARLSVRLDGLRAVVLSHGHYDHCGGLVPVLKRLGRLDVIAHPDAFARKYARRSMNGDRYIGVAADVDALTRAGAIMRLESQPVEISRGLVTTGPVPRVTAFERVESHFYVKTTDGWRPDHLEDDHALVVRTGNGLVVVLGCAHAGPINTVRHAMAVTGDERVRAVVGGLHLSSAADERIEKTVNALRELGVGQVVPCHCTGSTAKTRLRAAFGERYAEGGVGLKLTFQLK
ncbi:MAG: MBL fold metallo-hydrolase [Armatimonadota bacterium]|nr:MAG: MBL fold metallo-hydrolase [Armatimonadota bacterium]